MWVVTFPLAVVVLLIYSPAARRKAMQLIVATIVILILAFIVGHPGLSVPFNKFLDGVDAWVVEWVNSM